jgi:hypothetical protein
MSGGETQPIRKNGGAAHESRHESAGALMLGAYGVALVASGAGITLVLFGPGLIGALLLLLGVGSAVMIFLFGRKMIERELAFLIAPGPIEGPSPANLRRLILKTGRERSLATVAVRLSDPQLLPDLCAYLGRNGFHCRPREPAEVEVVLPETRSAVSAEFDLVMKIGLWQETRPGTEVAIEASR